MLAVSIKIGFNFPMAVDPKDMTALCALYRLGVFPHLHYLPSWQISLAREGENTSGDYIIIATLLGQHETL